MATLPAVLTGMEIEQLNAIRAAVQTRLCREDDWNEDEKAVAFLLMIVDLLLAHTGGAEAQQGEVARLRREKREMQTQLDAMERALMGA